MCGICGRFTFDDVPGDADLIRRMCARLVHRGPDDEGVHTGRSIGLGERRLAIIDLRPEAAAPLSNEDGTIWVVFNGEIYNYRELRAQLEQRGHRFRTRTDTEVLVHLYEDKGTELLRSLRGMFAFAIWDARKRMLFAARDRLGKKPFYYTRDARRLVFASELRSLLADPSVPVEPDFAALDAYLTNQYVPSPGTAFAGVHKLAAGHALVCNSAGELHLIRYWHPPAAEDVARSREELEAQLLDRLRGAVRVRLVSDVPLGAFLSGGIDSSLVVALMAEASAAPVRTFSIGVPHAATNELPYARMVAERYATDHHEFMVEPESLDVIPELVRHYGEPFADSSAVPTYLVSRLARRHVTVALTGDGGDESFSGYGRYYEVSRWSAADHVPRPLRRVAAEAVEITLSGTGPSGMSAKLRRAAAMLIGDVPTRYALQLSIFKPQEKRAFYTPSFYAAVRHQTAPNGAGSGPDDAIRWMMWHDLQHYLPDCLMVKTDVASMANSLEVRCPLLDHELVEFAASMPRALLRQGATGKLLLREVALPLLPPRIVNRPKVGFGVPLHAWFRGSLNAFVRGVLLDDVAVRRGMFTSAAVSRVIDEHTAGRRDWSNRLWALLMLELWFREFID